MANAADEVVKSNSPVASDNLLLFERPRGPVVRSVSIRYGSRVGGTRDSLSLLHEEDQTQIGPAPSRSFSRKWERLDDVGGKNGRRAY